MASLMEPLVTVRRQWNNPATAEYRLSAIGGIHWDSVSGGVGAPAPRPFLHGYVMCDEAVRGGVSHSCRHGPPPHRIKVCVVKRDNTPAVMRALQEKMEKQMTEKPMLPVPASRPHIDGKARIAALAESASRQQAYSLAYGIARSVGLAQKSAEALVAHGVNCRERLLFMSLDEIKGIRGVGKAAMEKICAYRSKFLQGDA